MALISGLLIAISSYKSINKKELLKICTIMIIGMCIGIQLCKVISSEWLLIVYGIIIIVVAGKNLFIHKEHHLPGILLLCVLIIAGIIHGMFVSGGALLVVYATQTFKDKDEFRATIAPVWVVLNSFITSQIHSHQFNINNIRLILISIVPLMIDYMDRQRLAQKSITKAIFTITYILSDDIRNITYSVM